MTRDEYMAKQLSIYRIVAVLADKNECRTLRLRYRERGQDMVVHSFPKVYDVYELLCGVTVPHLPEVFDAIVLEDGQVVLEEWIDGVTVAAVMETGRYRYRGAKRVLTSVCEGLTALHERGLVHRDIKPENVMIDTNGRVVLIDFNASRIVKEGSRDTTVMGTVGYVAPEQLGVAQSDARADVYALGVLLNVMLTGKHPGEQMAGGRAGRIVRKCTAISPDERYQTAAKFAWAL